MTIEQAHRAVSLLLQAARVDPVLVEAVRTVDRYLHNVEMENDRMRAALQAIAREDYRGPRPSSAILAEAALSDRNEAGT